MQSRLAVGFDLPRFRWDRLPPQSCLFGRSAGAPESCSDEVRDLGFGRSVELADDILDDPIRIRYALVLPEVLEPGRDHEGLQETSFLGCILEDVPGEGAVPPSLLAQIPDRGQESVTFLGIDAVFDGDQNRPAIRLRIDRQDRRRPMHGRREIDARTRLKLPTPG